MLKGLVHEMDLAFEDMHGQLVLGLNRGRGQFLNFLVATVPLRIRYKICFFPF